MTYLEMLMWFCNFLKNTVIPAIDNNAEAVKELQNLFTTLKNYVDNYFDNLDVQEEINNKLDEMVEDGTLDAILNNYVSIQKIYPTTTDLLSATDLVDGMKVKTLGYYSVNDGGGAEFIITDTASETEFQNQIGSLYATLLHEPYKINVLCLGVKNDGVTDNSTLLNDIFNNTLFNRYTFYFPGGVYYFNNRISVNIQCTILGAPLILGKINYNNPAVRAPTFKFNAENIVDNYCITLTASYKILIENICIITNAYHINIDRDSISNGETVTNTFTTSTYYNNVGGIKFSDVGSLKNLILQGFSGVAIYTRYYSTFDNINVYDSKICFDVHGSDNRFTNIRLYTCYLGFNIDGGGANQLDHIRIDESATYGIYVYNFASGVIISNLVTDYVNYAGVYCKQTSNCVINTSKLNRCGVLYSGFSGVDVPANDIDKAVGVYVENLQSGNNFEFECALSSNKDGSNDTKYYGPSSAIGVGGTTQSSHNTFKVNGYRFANASTSDFPSPEQIYSIIISKATGFIGSVKYMQHTIECAPLRGDPTNPNNLYNVIIDDFYAFPSSYISPASAPFRPGLFVKSNNNIYMSIGTNAGDWIQLSN